MAGASDLTIAATSILSQSVVKNPPVAVIDIGSNSIKVLVAARDESGRLHALKSKTIDARISAGISKGTVASTVFRALAALSRDLKEEM